ncbi:transcription factor bHLH91-like [Juglans microcarpa x Juglans regia]|uniref:transcription factor bHLH91-like n=1 Tax=Juglans microcarpa x Juglans regia TaxID=2249226 RepID=UPI001B7E0ACB|nr:transcription factor bHLH91-like [Juglans microcarpa x Juglans regia]
MSEDAVSVAGAEDGFSQTVQNCTHNNFEDNLRLSMEELSYQDHNQNQTSIHDQAAAAAAAATAMEIIELHQHLGFNMDCSYNGHNHSNTHLQIDIQNGHQSYDYSSLPNSPYPPTPDLLNLFHLPRCSASSVLPNSSISFSNPAQKTTASYQSSQLGFLGDIPTGADSASGASVLYDPQFHLNLPPQPPLFRQLFGQSLPNGYSLPCSGNGSLFGTGGDEREGNGGVYKDGDVRQFENGVLELISRDMGCIGKGRDGETKHFATERERRQNLNDKYKVLRSLVPKPTKADRASAVVGDAIEYIKDLQRTVNELKLLVEKKRCGREMVTKPVGDPHGGQSYNGSLRSSWLQRKSKDTKVDVRVIDDEVSINTRLYDVVRKEIWYRPDMYFYRDMLMMLTRNEKVDEAKQVSEDLKKEEVLFDQHTFGDIIRAFLDSKLPLEAMDIYDEMRLSLDPPISLPFRVILKGLLTYPELREITKRIFLWTFYSAPL